jgi:hypothetical protein
VVSVFGGFAGGRGGFVSGETVTALPVAALVDTWQEHEVVAACPGCGVAWVRVLSVSLWVVGSSLVELVDGESYVSTTVWDLLLAGVL